MLSFFKKNKDEQLKRQGSDSVVSAKDLLDEDGEVSVEEEVQTELSINPSWTLPSEQKYVYQFLNNECPPLKPNQLSLAGIELAQDKTGYIATAFVRNSLNKTVNFKSVGVYLIGPNDEKLAHKVFDLTTLGDLPARSSRPFRFKFAAEDLFSENIPEEGWKLAFELKPTSRKHALDLEESWKKNLTEADKEKLQQIAETVNPPKPGEINFMGLQVKQNNEGQLAVTMLIRNGSQKNINLNQLPLQVEDATGEVVAKGGFTLNELEVKANTSKPWTFVFPKELVLKEEMDLSKWKAYPVQNLK